MGDCVESLADGPESFAEEASAPRGAHPWLRGWAVPCAGAAGAGGNRLGPAWGSPGHPSQGLARQHPCAASTLTGKPSKEA